jgi:hypothetical protein
MLIGTCSEFLSNIGRVFWSIPTDIHGLCSWEAFEHRHPKQPQPQAIETNLEEGASGGQRFNGKSGRDRLERDEFWFDQFVRGLGFTSPIGRGRRVTTGEGLRSLDNAAPPHPICCANRPLPNGER